MRVDNNLKKTTKFSRITDFFKNRWMRENSPHSEEKSFQPKQFFLDLFLVLLGASISTFVVILTLSIKKIGKSTQDTTTASSIVDKQKINEDSAKKEIVLPTSSIVLFKDIPKNTLKRPLKGKSNLRFETRSAGTLVRVKLLNRLEVLKNAPIFAQIVDYSLGKTLYGKTVLGEASSDNESRKINMSFSKIKFSSKKTVNFKGEALSLDGTLGLLAKRLKGFSTRTALSASRGAEELVDKSYTASNSLEGVLVGALLKGFGKETSFEEKRAHTLILEPGQEFFIKLKDNFPERR